MSHQELSAECQTTKEKFYQDVKPAALFNSIFIHESLPKDQKHEFVAKISFIILVCA